jgi:hypothetical protein
MHWGLKARRIGKWHWAGLGAVLVLAVAGWLALPLLKPKPPAPKSLFADWSAIVVAGDWRAHSGAPSMIFDNARHELVQKFEKLGFQPDNIRQFSATPGRFPYETGLQLAAEGPISTGLAAVTARAKSGCLLYFTSHGTPEGIIIGDRIVDPAPIAAKVNEYCGDRPTVVIVSACFSGIFLPLLEGTNRMVFSAARPDRTSFGCGEQDNYTFFDTCFLSKIDDASSFPDLAERVDGCIEDREAAMNKAAVAKGAPPALPSQPQFWSDPKLVYAMRWK